MQAASGTDDYYEEVQEEEESSYEESSYYYEYTDVYQTGTEAEAEEATPVQSATIEEHISVEDGDNE